MDAPELINNLVLHDDDLVRVVESDDPAKRTNLVRIDYPEGPAYVDMRKHGNAGSPFNHSLPPSATRSGSSRSTSARTASSSSGSPGRSPPTPPPASTAANSP